jgi:nucleotide-binding universal stress UspA family protein
VLQSELSLTEKTPMFRQLLVAIDHTAAAPVALSFATALTRGEVASVHVIHANRVVVGGRGFTELTRAEATALVDTAVLQLLEQGVDATGSVCQVTSFSIGQVIADAARSRQCDAIILGSHRPARWSRLAYPFGRGTRERIIRHSSLPVLTAPPPLQVPGGRRRRRATFRTGNRHRPPSSAERPVRR